MLKNSIKALLRTNFVRQGLFVIILRFTGIAILFGTTVFITNYFSNTIVGAYEFSRSLLLLAASIVVLGTDQAILYYSGEIDKEQKQSTLHRIFIKMTKAVFACGVILSLVILLIPKLWFYHFFEEDTSYIIILKTVVVALFFALLSLNTEYIRALHKPFLSELYRGVFKHIPFLLGAGLLYALGLEEWLVDVFLIGIVMVAILSYIPISKLFLKVKLIGNTGVTTLQILKRSFPMAMTSLGFFLLLSIDLIVLKKYFDYAEIAIYAIAIKLILLLSTILNTINALISSDLAKAFINDREQLKSILIKSTRLIFLSTLPFTLGLLLAPELLLSIFGESYIKGATALRILCLGHLVVTCCGPLGAYLNMTGKHIFFRNIIFITILLNLGINLWLIPKMGIEGAAWASSISIIFWNTVAVIYVFKKDKIVMLIK